VVRKEGNVRSFLTVGLLLAAMSVPAGAGSIGQSYLSDDGKELGLIFDQGTGLSGQAIFRLTGPRTIDILLTNTSTRRPDDPWFDQPSDQMLTSLYFDLGAPGLNPADPRIIGGQAWVGEGGYSIGKDGSLSGGDEISTLWGFGNFQYDEPGQSMLPSNFITTNTAHSVAFAGAEVLSGPEYGLATGDLTVFPDTSDGLTAIRDTILATIWLDADLADLSSLIHPDSYTPHIEFGSDYEFLVRDHLPPFPVPAGAIPEPVTILVVSLSAVAVAGYCRTRLKRPIT